MDTEAWWVQRVKHNWVTHTHTSFISNPPNKPVIWWSVLLDHHTDDTNWGSKPLNWFAQGNVALVTTTDKAAFDLWTIWLQSLYSTKHSILSSKKKCKQSCLLKYVGTHPKGRTPGWVNSEVSQRASFLSPQCHRHRWWWPVSLWAVTVGDQQQPISSASCPFPASRKQASSTRMDVSRADIRKSVGCVFHSKEDRD